MVRNISGSISWGSARNSVFLFLLLFGLSTAFFVFADDAPSQKNIFQDSDQDGLSNDEEALYGTDPLNPDTDGDGYTDGVEVKSGYDPLKPAPGDRVTTPAHDGVNATTRPVTAMNTATSASSTGTQENLTEQLSTQVAAMVQSQSAGATGSEITQQSIADTVQSVMSQSSEQEIILPDVNTDTIKIKKLPKNLKAKDRKEQERQDAVEYLTVISYILANNSPKGFHSESELSSLVSSLTTDSLSAVTLGNTAYTEKLSERGGKMLKEIYDVEVPQGMLDVHVKAIKIAKYLIQLKDEMKGQQGQDPIGQISSLTRVQGFLGVVSDFSQEVQQKISDYSIKEIPINL